MSDGSAEQKSSNAPAAAPRGASTFAIVLCAVVVCGWIGVELLLDREKTPDLQPLTSAEAAVPYKPLPPNSPVLNIADGVNLSAPFVLREESSAAGGSSLFIPKGSRTKARNGRATLTLNVPSDGAYQAWARVRWSDSCSNSITLKIGDGEERTVGEDALYNVWHWVAAGKHTLKAGPVTVTLIEREDNLLLDQLVFATDAEYVPTGLITVAGETRGIRRFADDFSRSPGHGIGEWNIVNGDWRINFSFDPNRIPNQYALVGTAGQEFRAIALMKSAPWHGCRLSFSFFPQDAGEYGAILERKADGSDALQISFEVSDGKATVKASGSGVNASAELKDAMRLRQWHAVVIERWAWMTRVLVDGNVVLRSFEGAPRAGDAGMFVKSGSAVFDDVEAEEIPWQADDGRELAIAWKISEGGSWFREGGAAPGTVSVSAASKGAGTLTGRSGAISTSLAGMPVAEIVIEDESTDKESGRLAVDALGLEDVTEVSVSGKRIRTFCRSEFFKSPNPATSVSLRAQEGGARIHRVAVRYSPLAEKRYIIGPFHFTEQRIEDASDYLDFTREEYEEMSKSPDAEKLRRQAKFKAVIGGANSDNSPWNREAGNWGISSGVLRGYGPGAILRLAEETGGDLELTMRVRLFDARSSVEVEFDGGREPGVRVALAGGDAPKRERAPALSLAVGPGEWREFRVRLSEQDVTAGIGKNPEQSAKLTRGDGRRFFLKVPSGSAEFDDVQITMPRRTASSSFASFQQREAEWWREGNWIDHAGIACVQASSWVSLIASDSSGMLWNKREFGPDAAVAFGVEENTEWYGWDKPHSHDHLPFDNICAVLGTRVDRESGYRLEINSENRTATVLYRNGRPVARTAQNQQFPIIYVGGHAPFAPRTNHVQLFKRGNLIRGVINAREVIRFEDPEPLDVKRAGVGGYKTRINFSQIDVRTVR